MKMPAIPTWQVRYWGGPLDGLETTAHEIPQFVPYVDANGRYLYQRSNTAANGVYCYGFLAEVSEEPMDMPDADEPDDDE